MVRNVSISLNIDDPNHIHHNCEKDKYVQYSRQMDTVPPYASAVFSLWPCMLTEDCSTSVPCGPEDFGVGDIASVEFGVIVVKSRSRGKMKFRMTCVLRGVKLLQKRMLIEARHIILCINYFYLIISSNCSTPLPKMKVYSTRELAKRGCLGAMATKRYVKCRGVPVSTT